MMDDLPERLARFPDQKLEVIHTRLFGELFPQAKRFAEHRTDFIQRQIAESIRLKPSDEKVVAPASPTASLQGSSSAASATAGRTKKGDAKSKEAKDPEGGKVSRSSLRRSPTSASRLSEEAADASAASDTEAVEEDEEVDESTSLYAHTFAVLKGELLMSQMMEPEVLHFLVEFRPLFHQLFDAYVDVPMPDAQGHMTQNSFLRFCSDFGLFPSQVDFQSLQWLYNTAESCSNARGQRVSVAPPHVAVSVDPGDTPTSGTGGENTARARIVSSKSTASMTSMASSKLPRVGGGGGQTDIDVGGKKRTARKAKTGKSPLNRSQKCDEPEVLWSGKWIRGCLAWMTKDLAEKSEVEVRSANILDGMNEWMIYRGFSINDLFIFLVPQKQTLTRLPQMRSASKKSKAEESERDYDVISHEVLIQAIDFMKLEDPPSHEEVYQLISLIIGSAKQDIDFGLLKEVFNIVSRLKDNLQRAKNCFLKDPAHMTQAEYSASMFFRELMFVLERNRWTPEQLFKKIDTDGSGEVDIHEMEREVRTFVKTQPFPMNKALSVEHPFEILDINHDERVTREEFVFIFEQVKQAREAQKDAEVTHPLFLSTSGLPKHSASSPRIFGRHAFVECLLKIALVHLSFHGTAHQAEQTSFFKALWLVLYLHSNFKRAASKVSKQQTAPRSLVKPMRRLLKDQPNLFQDAGLEATPGFSVWGKKVDKLLQQCLTDPSQPRASGHLSLDGQLLASAVD